MNDRSVARLTYYGLFAALIFVATYFLKIILPIGYIHLGDGMILAGAVLLGPSAWLPAALGSALADLLLGYSAYILPTFLIKGLVAFLAGLFLSRIRSIGSSILVFVLVEILMVAGYFITEMFLYGFAGALPQLVPNLLQGASGVVVVLALYPSLQGLRRRM